MHRDLKPGNIMLTRTGARLLDFGLARSAPGAKLLQHHHGLLRGFAWQGLTTEGTILGTLSYMAPEQIDGREIQTRADVFAFGAVLFEMVTGLKAFEGESAARVMSAILRDEPARVSSIVPVTPAALEALIHACLAKDPNERWQNISGRRAATAPPARDDERHEIGGDVRIRRHCRVRGVTGAGISGEATTRVGLPMLAGAAAAVFGTAAIGLAVDCLRSTAAPAEAPLALQTVSTGRPPEGMYLTDTLALSPDGRRLAFVAADPDRTQAALGPRSSTARTPQSLADTDGASEPFWSPDGQQIAFFAGGRLRRVPAAGGTVTTICPSGDHGSAAGWNKDDVLVFAEQDGPMMRVAASGGRPRPLTTFDRALAETHHLYPAFLPDGRHYTYYVNSRERGVYVGELGSATRTRLFDPDPALAPAAAVTPAIDPPTGHLLYVRDRVLMARRFDLASLSPSTASPRRSCRRWTTTRPDRRRSRSRATCSCARASIGRSLSLVWVDRAGKQIGAIESPPGAFRTLTINGGCADPSPSIVVMPRVFRRCGSSMPRAARARGSRRRTGAAIRCGRPTAARLPTAWRPTRRRISWSAATAARAPSGAWSSSQERIQYATSFTPDGKQIVYSALTAVTGSDLDAISTTDQTTDAAAAVADELQRGSRGRVSPDGRWSRLHVGRAGEPEAPVCIPFSRDAGQGRCLLIRRWLSPVLAC